MTLQLKFTEDQTYIRIVDPQNDHFNWAIISPSDGQVSVKDEFWEKLDNEIRDSFNWKDGEGRHGGSSFRCHSTDEGSLGQTLKQFDSFCRRNNFIFNLKLG